MTDDVDDFGERSAPRAPQGASPYSTGGGGVTFERRVAVMYLARLLTGATASDIGDVAFCFLDAEKEVYSDCYEAVVPNLVSGGLLVADNAINHRETLQLMLDRALSDPRLDAVIVPIGKGELVCRMI